MCINNNWRLLTNQNSEAQGSVEMNKILNKIKTFISILAFMFKPTISARKKTFFNSTNPDSMSLIPKIIWVYWEGNQTSLVKLCLKNIESKNRGYEINFISDINYSSFIDDINLPDNIIPAHKSDLIRLNLLYKYGGIYIDATTILSESFDWMLDICNYDDVFLCYSDDCTSKEKYPIAENWLIGAPKHSIFIKNWLSEFSKSIYSPLQGEYFKVNSQPDYIIQNIPDLDYLRCYVACSIIMNENSYNLIMINSGSMGHFYNYALKSKAFFIAIITCLYNSDNILIPPVIKFTSSTRYWIDFFIKHRIYRKNSLISNAIDRD